MGESADTNWVRLAQEKSKAERRKKKMDKAGAGQDKERKGAD